MLHNEKDNGNADPQVSMYGLYLYCNVTALVSSQYQAKFKFLEFFIPAKRCGLLTTCRYGIIRALIHKWGKLTTCIVYTCKLLKGRIQVFFIRELDVPPLGESNLMGPKKSVEVKFFTVAFFGCNVIDNAGCTVLP